MAKAYVNRKGQEKCPKKMKNGCEDCKYKCSEKPIGDERQQIFSNFWIMGNDNPQTKYILSNIQTRSK